jgi:hypothetical protein
MKSAFSRPIFDGQWRSQSLKMGVRCQIFVTAERGARSKQLTYYLNKKFSGIMGVLEPLEHPLATPLLMDILFIHNLFVNRHAYAEYKQTIELHTAIGFSQ